MSFPSDFLSHLEELRKRLLICFFTFMGCAILSYIFSKDLLDFLIQPLIKFQTAELIFHKPHEAFLIHLKVAGLVGFLISLPVIFTQTWLFILPALYEKERKVITPLILVSVLLFLAGALFAYYLVIPFGLNFLLSFQTEYLKPLIGVAHYFAFLTGMVLAFGILFDFPVVIIGIVGLGIVKTEQLAKARKFVVIAIFILAAILTPSPDPVSQLLLAGPLLILFEISLLIARRLEKKDFLSKRKSHEEI